MEKINEITEWLKNQKHENFYEENFNNKANEKRFYEFLDKYILKYVSDTKRIEDSVIEKDTTNSRDMFGVFFNEDKVWCIVPKRKTLLDEMINIHEITHLINYFAYMNGDRDIAKDVIPYFNEYDYLRKIHPFYAEYYEKFRLNDAIITAKETSYDLSKIYAYYILQKRKENYDINVLNKINTKGKNLGMKLTSKGYTL